MEMKTIATMSFAVLLATNITSCAKNETQEINLEPTEAQQQKKQQTREEVAQRGWIQVKPLTMDDYKKKQEQPDQEDSKKD